MFTEQEVTLGEIRCNLARGPQNGPPLVMFHGVTRCWQCLLPVMRGLTDRWWLHVIDFPGHGGTRDSLESFRVIDYVTAMEPLVTGYFEEPAALYGHSLGAMVAGKLAAEFPERVRGVVMEDPPFETMGNRIGRTPLLSYFRSLREFAGIEQESLAETTGRLAEVKVVDPLSGTATMLGDVRTATALRMMAFCLRNVKRQVLDPIVSEEWLEEYDFDAVCRGLRTPALLLRASPSLGGMLTQRDAENLARSAADLTLRKHDEVGHQMHWADTQWVVNECTMFLETIR